MVALHSNHPLERIGGDSDWRTSFPVNESMGYGVVDQVIERSVATWITT